MNKRSDGEEAYARVFQFVAYIPEEDCEELRDFLYKFAHNYTEAKDYLQILKQIHEVDYSARPELLFRIHGMALASFALALRRITDNISKRSMQKFITKVVHQEFRDTELQKIKDIHSHYKQYIDKGVAHQDENSIKDVLSAFPNSDVIEADMDHLKNLYLKLVKEMCTSFINIEGMPYDYSHELQLLRQPSKP